MLEFWKDASFPFQRAAFFQVSGSQNGLTFPKNVSPLAIWRTPFGQDKSFTF